MSYIRALSPVADFLCRLRAALLANGAETVEDSIGCVRAFVFEDEELIGTRLHSLGQPEDLARAVVERGEVAETFLVELTERAAVGDGLPTSRKRLEELTRNPRDAHRRYEDPKTIALARDLLEQGQRRPVVVVDRKVFDAHHPDLAGDAADTRWVIVTGNRLHAAAQLAGVAGLDVVVRDHLGGHDPRLSEVTLLERLHHQGLPPLLEARELQSLIQRHGSQSAVAKRLGKSQPWVSQRLALLRLSTEMQDALEHEEITIREARRIATAAPQDQVRALGELRAGPAGSPPEPTSGPSTSGCPLRAPSFDVDDPQPSRTSCAARGVSAAERTEPERLDLGRIARDLRTRLTCDERSHLVQLLQPARGDAHRGTVVGS